MSQRSVNNERTQKKYRGESVAKDDQFSVGRRTAAKGKPTREKSAGVTVMPSSSAAKAKQAAKTPTRDLTKEERREQREVIRNREDRVDAATDIYMQGDPAYGHQRRVWWGLLGGGFVSIILSFIFQRIGATGNEGAMIACMVFLVLAYVGIIAGFIYDLVVVNKVRKKYRTQAESLSDKKIDAMIAENRARRDEEGEPETFFGRVKAFFSR